ncbi:hypothetical protein GCM10023322_34680 [Rugosimonospora acidiphila]|uniref:Uncharacterized protein n=1 Tax=Rugosimonospora acidiphila TaxID=556531 RepID=A0ABP9RW12_9ACTN
MAPAGWAAPTHTGSVPARAVDAVTATRAVPAVGQLTEGTARSACALAASTGRAGRGVAARTGTGVCCCALGAWLVGAAAAGRVGSPTNMETTRATAAPAAVRPLNTKRDNQADM